MADCVPGLSATGMKQGLAAAGMSRIICGRGNVQGYQGILDAKIMVAGVCKLYRDRGELDLLM